MICRLSGGNKLFSHLLVVPPTDSASTVKFSSTFNTAYSRYAIQYNGNFIYLHIYLFFIYVYIYKL